MLHPKITWHLILFPWYIFLYFQICAIMQNVWKRKDDKLWAEGKTKDWISQVTHQLADCYLSSIGPSII